LEIIDKDRFEYFQNETITFKDELKSTRIKEYCLYEFQLKLIKIQKNVEIIDNHCFSRVKLEMIIFGIESKLVRIEEKYLYYS